MTKRALKAVMAAALSTLALPLGQELVIDPFLVVESRGRVIRRRLTATEQVKLIGNSVCPQVAAALVRANLRALNELYDQRAITA